MPIRPRPPAGTSLSGARAAEQKDREQMRRLLSNQSPSVGGGAAVYVQDDAPSSPVKGTLWFDTDAGV